MNEQVNKNVQELNHITKEIGKLLATVQQPLPPNLNNTLSQLKGKYKALQQQLEVYFLSNKLERTEQ